MINEIMVLEIQVFTLVGFIRFISFLSDIKSREQHTVFDTDHNDKG